MRSKPGRPKKRQGPSPCEWVVTVGNERRTFTRLRGGQPNSQGAEEFHDLAYDEYRRDKSKPRPELKVSRYLVRDWVLCDSAASTESAAYEQRETRGRTPEEAIEKMERLQLEARLRNLGGVGQHQSEQRIVVGPLAVGAGVSSDDRAFFREQFAAVTRELESADERFEERKRRKLFKTIRQHIEAELDRLVDLKEITPDDANKHRSRLIWWERPARLEDGTTFIFGDVPVDLLHESHLTSWLEMLRMEPNSRGRRNTKQTFLHITRPLRLLWKRFQAQTTFKHIPQQLPIDLMLREEAEKCSSRVVEPRRELLLDEIQRLVNAIDTPTEAGMIAMMLCGLRPEEVAAVRFDELVQDLGTLWVLPRRVVHKGRVVNGTKADDRRIGEDGELYCERRCELRNLPLTRLQVKLVELARGHSQPFIAAEPGGRLPDTLRLNELFGRLVESAGIERKGVSPNTMRHNVHTYVARAFPRAVIKDRWSHAKRDATTGSKWYDLREADELNATERRKFMRHRGKPASEFLPWNDWNPPQL